MHAQGPEMLSQATLCLLAFYPFVTQRLSFFVNCGANLVTNDDVEMQG